MCDWWDFPRFPLQWREEKTMRERKSRVPRATADRSERASKEAYFSILSAQFIWAQTSLFFFSEGGSDWIFSSFPFTCHATINTVRKNGCAQWPIQWSKFSELRRWFVQGVVRKLSSEQNFRNSCSGIGFSENDLLLHGIPIWILLDLWKRSKPDFRSHDPNEPFGSWLAVPSSDFFKKHPKRLRYSRLIWYRSMVRRSSRTLSVG